MATNVGSLSVRLGMPSDQLQSDANKARAIVSNTQKMLEADTIAMQQKIQQAAPKQIKFAPMAQQLGFGLQDFTSQLNNSKTVAEGLGRGIGAVSNNVQMLGAAFGPTGMAVTAIGAAVAGIVLPKFIEWVSNSKQLAEEMKLAEERAKSLADTISKVAGLPIKREQIDDPRDRAIARAKEVDDALDAQRLAVERIKLLDDAARDSKTAAELKAILERRDAEVKAQREAQLEMNLLTRNGIDEDRIRRDANAARASKKLDEDLAKEKKQRAELAADDERHSEEFDRWVKDEKRKRFDAETREIERKTETITKQIEVIREQGTTPAASSAMSVSGTAAAASAINRALSGSQSEESDRKKQIRILEDQLKTQREIARERHLHRAELF